MGACRQVGSGAVAAYRKPACFLWGLGDAVCMRWWTGGEESLGDGSAQLSTPGEEHPAKLVAPLSGQFRG